MKQKMTFFDKLFIAYEGTSDDLVFWVLIDSLFLSNVKGLSSGDISLIISISSILNLILRTPCYKLLKKLGNGNSLIVGALLFLGSACCFTFGEGIVMMGVGQLLYTLAPLFQCIASAVLMDKLNSVGQGSRFVRIMSLSYVVCSGLSVLCAVIIGVLLKLNRFLPMYLCIIFCINSVVLAVMLSKHEVPVKAHPVLIPGRRHISLTSAVIKCLIILSLSRSMIKLGNTNLKLYFQELSDAAFPAEQTIAWFTVMITSTRIVKLLANIFVSKTKNQKTRDLCVYLLPLIGTVCLCMVIFGVGLPPAAGAIVTAIAFMAVTFLFDPVNTIILDKAIRNAGPAEKPLIISTIEMGKMLFVAVSTAISAAILSKFSLVSAIALLAVITLLMAFLGFIWRKSLVNKREHFSFYGLEKINNQPALSGLTGAVAFLIGHYRLRRKKSGSELLHIASVDLLSEKDKKIFESYEEQEYSFDTLLTEYQAGHPCAVEIIRNTENADPEWLPIAYMDTDGALTADYVENSVKFLSEFPEVRRICSFKIRGRK